jgi:hypothetical protein
VADLAEAVLTGDGVGPSFDGRTLDLDRASAGAADQVVVVTGAASPVDRFAVPVRSMSTSPQTASACSVR